MVVHWQVNMAFNPNLDLGSSPVVDIGWPFFGEVFLRFCKNSEHKSKLRKMCLYLLYFTCYCEVWTRSFATRLKKNKKLDHFASIKEYFPNFLVFMS